MNNTNQPYSPKGIIKTITVLHYAYCISIIVFGTVALFITENPEFNFNNSEDVFFYLVPTLAIVAPVIGNIVFKKNLEQIHEKETVKEKLINYQTARLIRIAFIEAPALLGVVIFLITSNQYYLIFSAVLLTYLITLRPTISVIKTELRLNNEQAQEFSKAIE